MRALFAISPRRGIKKGVNWQLVSAELAGLSLWYTRYTINNNSTIIDVFWHHNRNANI